MSKLRIAQYGCGKMSRYSMGADFVLCDGSPGVGCPVISSLSGAALAVAVVEATPSGRHDFGRVAELCDHFRIPVAVLINKADLNEDEAERIRALAREKGYALVGELPFSPLVTQAMGLSVTSSPKKVALPLAKALQLCVRPTRKVSSP